MALHKALPGVLTVTLALACAGPDPQPAPQPVATEPGATEPVALATESMAAEPGPSEPTESKASPAELGPATDAPSESAPSNPGPREPGPSKPAPSEPGLSEPGPGGALAEAVEPLPWKGSSEIESNAGSFIVQYRTDTETIPWGDPFELEVRVLSNGNNPRLLKDVQLSVDAAMPEHGHGMNRVPEIASTGDGSYHVGGMLMHMPGRWELYFDVTKGSFTERAQAEVELD